jgi:hypothetical protein
MWLALEQAHLPCTLAAAADNGHTTADSHAADERAHFYEKAGKLKGHWHVPTGANVGDVRLHLHSDTFVVVRGHGGTEKAYAQTTGRGLVAKRFN